MVEIVIHVYHRANDLEDASLKREEQKTVLNIWRLIHPNGKLNMKGGRNL